MYARYDMNASASAALHMASACLLIYVCVGAMCDVRFAAADSAALCARFAHLCLSVAIYGRCLVRTHFMHILAYLHYFIYV